MIKPKSFKTHVERFAGTGTWTYASIPFDIEKEFGEKGQIRVKGTINGQTIEAALMPQGNRQHFIILNKEIRDKTGIKVGDTIDVMLIKDDKPKEIIIAEDFMVFLKKNKTAFEYFDSLAPSHKKEYVNWVGEAKKKETRKNRIIKAIEKLSAKQKLR